MDTAYITSKMNEFMFRLRERMGKWLGKKLPRITENWWDELVLSNLSMLQREKVLNSNIHELSGLDLASLLRVFDRNWFVITSTCFVNKRLLKSKMGEAVPEPDRNTSVFSPLPS